MPDYKAMYYALAAQVADAIELLIGAQRSGEEGALADACETVIEQTRAIGYNGEKPSGGNEP